MSLNVSEKRIENDYVIRLKQKYYTFTVKNVEGVI